MSKPHIVFFLKEMRIERGLTQDELAQRSGYSKTHISHLEAGLRRWNEGTILAMCSALDCTPRDLFNRYTSQERELLEIWRSIPEDQHPTWLAALRAFARESNSGQPPTNDN